MRELIASLKELIELRQSCPPDLRGEIDKAISAILDALPEAAVKEATAPPPAYLPPPAYPVFPGYQYEGPTFINQCEQKGKSK